MSPETMGESSYGYVSSSSLDSLNKIQGYCGRSIQWLDKPEYAIAAFRTAQIVVDVSIP